MKTITLGSLILAGTLAISGTVTTANADVMRIAIAVADNKADYDANVGMTAIFADLYRKAGATSVYVGTDAENLSWASFSVWHSEADIDRLTNSPAWKAEFAKLKYENVRVEVFQLDH
jgi:hypothetical protein